MFRQCTTHGASLSYKLTTTEQVHLLPHPLYFCNIFLFPRVIITFIVVFRQLLEAIQKRVITNPSRIGIAETLKNLLANYYVRL